MAPSRSYLQAGAQVFRISKTASGSNEWTPDQPLFILLLGSDMRPGAGCGCSDAIHVVGVPAGGGQATIINVPRDTRIDVPGKGLSKLTEAMATGGAQLTAQAISQWMGVTISYTIITSFDGLPAMVDELGGVTVNVPGGWTTSFTNVHLDPGPTPMGGDLALRFARSRHITGSDYQRTQNQALLILSTLGEMRAAGTSPTDTLKYLGILARHTTLDGVSTPDLYRLARVGAGHRPGQREERARAVGRRHDRRHVVRDPHGRRHRCCSPTSPTTPSSTTPSSRPCPRASRSSCTGGRRSRPSVAPSRRSTHLTPGSSSGA